MTSSSPRTSATRTCSTTNRARRRRCSAAAARWATPAFARCMIFHSLSKRSSLPGLRSGFVAGDAALIKPFLLYRTYHGCAMPVPTQLASISGLERRRACRREPRAVPAQVRPRAADPAPVISAHRPGRWLLPVARRSAATTRPSRRPVRGAESHRRARQLPWRAQTPAGNPGRGLRAHLARCAGRRMCAGCHSASAISSCHGTPVTKTCNDSLRRPSKRPSKSAPTSRRQPSTAALRQAVEDCIGLLDTGRARVAEKARRQLAGQRMAEEGRAAVLPRQRQPARWMRARCATTTRCR